MSWESDHFKRYINWEFCIDNYEEIIKTGFDFPKLFISYIKHYCYSDTEKINQLLDKFCPNIQKEKEYYPLLKLIDFTEKYPEFRDLLKPCALNYSDSVALIFSKMPNRWGLRGDPYFWTYLEKLFVEYSIPMDAYYFEKFVNVKYHKLSGGKKIGQRVYIKGFAHGGMSSGELSDVWLDVLPLLKYRLIKLNNDYYLFNGEPSKVIKDPKKIIKTRKKSLDEILEQYDG